MDIQLSDVTAWVIVGLLVGPLVGRISAGRKGGYGWPKNAAIGLVGALIGGVLWELLGVHIKTLRDVSVSLEDRVTAAAGAFLLLIALKLVMRKKQAAT